MPAVGKEIVEVRPAGGHLQPVDTAETPVVEHHDGELLAQHDRGGDFGIGHEIGSVAYHHHDLAPRLRHLHAEPAGDLIAHAAVAVFHMVGARRPRQPELVQLARQPACGADHRRLARHHPLDRADHLRIRRQGRIRRRGGRGDAGLPADQRSRRAAGPVLRRGPAADQRGQFAQSRQRIRHHRLGPVLGRVKDLRVQSDDPGRRAGEQAPRSRGEILQPGADRQHHIGLAGQFIRR